MKSFLIVVLTFGLLSFAVSKDETTNYVPNEETAIKIAEAIWLPIYGKSVLNEKPYNAKLEKDHWIVEGTLKADYGGVAYIEIQKSDCKIIKVSHGK